MSTKWNNNLKLQKTPKVCKKVPPAPGEPDNQYRYYPLQAYADWTEPFTPLEQAISGYTQLAPLPLTNTHFGQIIATRARLDLTLTYNPSILQLTYIIDLYINDIFEDAVSVSFIDPPALLPFTAGLYTWNDTIKPKLVHSKIYS